MWSSGEVVTAHCANPGAMLGLAAPGSRVWLSRSDNPARKLCYSWELIEVAISGRPTLVGINTGRPNCAVAAAIERGLIPGLQGYGSLAREVAYGDGCRIDILLRSPDKPACYVEVKNAHLMRKAGLAEFPDSVTARGAKHLAELAKLARGHGRAGRDAAPGAAGRCGRIYPGSRSRSQLRPLLRRGGRPRRRGDGVRMRSVPRWVIAPALHSAPAAALRPARPPPLRAGTFHLKSLRSLEVRRRDVEP
jgi:hypothetical protein